MMEHFDYGTRGICSQSIHFDLEDGILHNISFNGGCNGNLKAISKLLEGHPGEECVRLLKGNDCGGRGTSCADQLARAVEHAMQSAS